jgi:uncharacterized protein
LGVSLGQSAIYALVSLIAKLTADKPLNQQAARLNTSLAPERPWLDLTYQILAIFFDLMAVLLAWHLLNRDPGNARGLLGVDTRRWRLDIGLGVGLAAAIGIPGLGLYFAARELGINATVVPAGLPDIWWAVPILVLAAIQNSILEEVVVVGYLVTRLRTAWTIPMVIATSAILRGAYHLYQGFGAFIGNAVMGVVFALVFLKWQRIAPLVIAHTILDVVAFVGYVIAVKYLHWTA